MVGIPEWRRCHYGKRVVAPCKFVPFIPSSLPNDANAHTTLTPITSPIDSKVWLARVPRMAEGGRCRKTVSNGATRRVVWILVPQGMRQSSRARDLVTDEPVCFLGSSGERQMVRYPRPDAERRWVDEERWHAMADISRFLCRHSANAASCDHRMS